MVKIVIPLYRATLKPEEEQALENNLHVLSKWPVAFIKPEGLDISNITRKYPQAEIIEVSDEWLGTKNGIAGYNAMMMSADFYRLFSDCEFILICHTDAWIFRDELDQWIEKPVDHVAAPWIAWPLYSYFPFKQIMAIRRFLTPKAERVRSDTYGHIGNGGLSLRRVTAFINACEQHHAAAERSIQAKKSLYNEDVFFALDCTELRVPTVEEAMHFAFDVKPPVCYRLIGKQLPMGCHGYMHRSRKGFWKKFIPITASER